MDIRNGNAAFDAEETTDIHILAQREEELVLGVLHGALAVDPGRLHEGVNISRILLGNDLGKALDESDILEVVGVGNEVGFAVDFNENADAIDDGSISHTFSGNAVGFLCLGSKTLLTQ